ncbi:centrosomal protein of 192 kDa isoform X1 [Dipodomys spectabilis]|uniref:centrosomal protein of 192 kDa isoform X1 n=1 Tax=Dipodomys spectabilis TaxID=105255 RepID=UPI001C5401DC|nr:centrosomal protein of 192 kDa isoform X1 [Dipodomys spectabilis]
MEDFQGIAEESFPSFFTNSLLGNSEILENVTLSSNLGLPVAVSTLARNRSIADNRFPDVQASYFIEGRFSVPSASSPSCQSDTEPRERLKLSFQEDEKKICKESPHLSEVFTKQSTFQSDTPRAEEEQAKSTASLQRQDLLHSVSPLEQVPDSPDFCLKSWMNTQEHKIVVPDAGKEAKTLNSDLNHVSFLENEKLMSLASLEDSSDDDINDEEFYDEHLEAYFEQLAIPGIIYEDLEERESSEKYFKLPSQTNEDSSFNSKSECSSSHHGSNSLRSSETVCKESEEAHTFCLPGTSNSVGTVDSTKQEGGMLSFYPSNWCAEKERDGSLKDIFPDQHREMVRENILEKTLNATSEKLNSIYFHTTNAEKSDCDQTDFIKDGEESPHQNKHLPSDLESVLHKDRCSHTETPTISIKKDMGTESSMPTNDGGINSTNNLWSSNSGRITCEYHESIEKKRDLSENVVYQNEEGKWVTDLAYYTSFDNKQDVQMSPNNGINEDFRSGSEALDLIARDEEEFNKEHQFVQAENIDVQNISATFGDSSWVATINFNLLKKSHNTSEFDPDDASYLRLSLGEFFAERSEALGCLGGGNSEKRPSFGYFIRSPEEREPVALIQKSDVSRDNWEEEIAHPNPDQFSEDVNETSQAQLSEGSVTLQAETLESISQVDEHDVTLTANKVKTEDTSFSSVKHKECNDSLHNDGDSVLRISTIASAIADVSVSADPAQLVVMMKALRNKTRDKTSYQDDNQKGHSTVSHPLPNDLEKNNGYTAFDMEKYLKKTEVSRSEGGLEEPSRAGTSDIWNLSLPKEQTIQDIHMVDSCATNIIIREPKEKIATLFCDENGEQDNQEPLGTEDSSGSVLKITRIVDTKTCFIDNNKLSDMHNNEKETSSVSTPTTNSYSSVRNPRITSHCFLQEYEEIRENRENQNQKECVSEASSSDKHVTFEEQCNVPSESDGLKNTSPEHAGSGLQEDPESFRPSTSSLSHSPSEISGTSLSRCASECLASIAHHQKLSSESELSQSVCSHTDDMSRLTYMSEQESTCPATTADSCPEDHKSDITSELSSTITQADLTLSEEQAIGNLREKVPVHNRRKGILSCIAQSKFDLEKGTETTSLSSRPEDGESYFTSSQDSSSKSREPVGTSEEGLTPNPSELDLISLTLLSKADVGLQAGSASSHLSGSSQKTTEEGQRITSKDPSTASSDTSGQILNQSTLGNQLNLPPCLMGHGSAVDMQNMPAVHPSLWTGHSVSTAPLAQQYLGTFPSTANVNRPPCHAGSTSVCGFSGYSYPSVAGEHMAMGICLGPTLASGLMGPSSFCNSCSNALRQNLLSTAKPFSVQSVGANCGIEQWNSGTMPRFGNVRVPEELKFPHACCVGIASQTHLSVLNPTDRWLQVSIGVLSVSVNGEKVDLSTYPCLVFKNKVIIRPHVTEEIKVLFIPSNPGIFRCIFSVTSWPFSADTETIVQAEALGSRVILTAIAEAPAIEVETEKKGVLDFGDLTYGGWKVLPLKVINRTNAVVPIRMIINANAFAWRCFTFSKEPVHASLKAAPYADVIAQLAAPSVVSHIMPASFDGQDPEFLIVWVLFHSPTKPVTSSEILDSAEEFLARVDIEVDSPNPTPILMSVSLRARAGIARIHAPKDLQTVHLLASVNSSMKQHLPLKNAGNIEVYLDIKVQEQGSHFSVDPENLFLRPGEEHEVTVSFTPKDLKSCEERILKIFVQPFGPQYEVLLKGEVISSESTPLPGPCCSDIPSILSNKQFLTWGGVPLGRTQLQKLALRSNSTSTTQHLRLLIRGQDQDCFQFQNTFGSEERLTSSCEIRIHPKEDIIVSVLFTPTRLSCMLAKLEIKQLGNRSQPGIKFMIPLSGYGGTSNLILEGVKKLSDSYMVTVNDLIPGKESKIVFSVRNTGSRAAFVKAVGFKDSQKKILLDPKVLRIIPDNFILKERTREDVTLIYNPSDRKSDNNTATELSTIYFFGGDEISRQQYRRALLQKPGIIKQILPEHSVLQNINFVEAFQDELLIEEVHDLPQRPNDIQLFYGNMRKIMLSVIGEFRDSVPNRELLQPSPKASLESKSELRPSDKHGGNISLDVLPVKGPQGSPFLSQAAHSSQDTAASEEMWTIQPEHLILVAPSSCDMTKTGRFQIVNNSVRLLKFELYWPAHCLTVTPQHGFIAPESKLQILVSPNSSLSTKQSMFPWSGLIYIHCDNGQKKFVKVQIQEDLTQDELLTRLASSTFGILNTTSEPPISHVIKPVVKPSSTKVEIRNKMITFPTTESGKTSENYLEFENHGPVDVKWHLSSFAPPYVKGVDESGDVFRATYTAFRCSPISGTLERNRIQKVSITFLPRDRGDYAQFWDIECHPVKEPHMQHTLRFQLSGKSIRAENKPGKARSSTDRLIKVDNVGMSRKCASLEASALPLGRQGDLSQRGVYAPEDVYVFLPTRVGESRTLKVNLRNSSFITHSLKFLSPREPFHIKHSKYSLRARHYIHIPVHFRPEAAGRFEALLIIQTDEGKSVAVRLIGEALEKN